MKKFILRIIIFWFQHRGWRFSGPLPKSLKNCVIVVAPHQRRTDFFLGIAVCLLAKFRTDIMVHEKYLRSPVGKLLNSLGARPFRPGDDERWKKWVLKNIRKRPQYSVVITTRLLHEDKSVFHTHWYDVAAHAHIAIVPVAIDYKRKTIRIHSHFYPSVSPERDITFVRNFFAGFSGRMPENTQKASPAVK